jgi:hypothetical protein
MFFTTEVTEPFVACSSGDTEVTEGCLRKLPIKHLFTSLGKNHSCILQIQEAKVVKFSKRDLPDLLHFY